MHHTSRTSSNTYTKVAELKRSFLDKLADEVAHRILAQPSTGPPQRGPLHREGPPQNIPLQDRLSSSRKSPNPTSLIDRLSSRANDSSSAQARTRESTTTRESTEARESHTLRTTREPPASARERSLSARDGRQKKKVNPREDRDRNRVWNVLRSQTRQPPLPGLIPPSRPLLTLAVEYQPTPQTPYPACPGRGD